jgi:hypothetical protein
MATLALVLPSTGVSATSGVGLTDAEQALLLSKQNDTRAMYAVQPLAWDDSLAAYATDWANQLAAGDGSLHHRPNNRYGENIYALTPTGFLNVGAAVDSWVGEASTYTIATNACSSVCGHFTQIVWSTTTRVGCGKASGAGWDFLVCNYDPVGNVVGQSPGILAATQPIVSIPSPSLTTAPATSAGLQPSSCVTPTHSLDSSQPATLVFVNESALTLFGYWIDYTGATHQWFTLAPGAVQTQPTFATNAWALVDASGTCQLVYVAMAGTVQVTLR